MAPVPRHRLLPASLDLEGYACGTRTGISAIPAHRTVEPAEEARGGERSHCWCGATSAKWAGPKYRTLLGAEPKKLAFDKTEWWPYQHVLLCAARIVLQVLRQSIPDRARFPVAETFHRQMRSDSAERNQA